MPTRTEAARLDALRQLDLLDTPPSEAFDRITRMAAQIFGLPIAAVSLTDQDRQWFKSRVGVEHDTIPREGAPCAEVAATADRLVIPDLLADECYRASQLAGAGIRFYAGAPLTTRDGFCLGAMCVLGTEPREITPAELSALSDLAAMVMAQIELQHAFGRIDPLSGMANRNQFLEDVDDLARERPLAEGRLAALIDLAGPEQLATALRVMGSGYLDGFVREAAQALRESLAPGTRAYHVASTQFALLPGAGADEEGFAAGLEPTLDALGSAMAPRFMGSAVIGLAPFRLGRDDPRDVLRAAHGAAQDARGGTGRVSTHSPARDAVHKRRFRLLHEFGRALEGGDQLSLAYQPRIDLVSGECAGAEALLRWAHPALGQVSPGEFMPLVERTSMARAATDFVLDAALAELAAWERRGLGLSLSVNVSAANLAEPDFAERVLAALRRHDVAPAALELEVTETAVMEDAGRALALLHTIADAGIRLAIDDFGTGYSSLAYLQRLPVHVAKIDQSFMRDIAGDERKRVLVSAMIGLAHDIGHRVVAEGVETEEALAFATGARCDEAQGYLFARPMPAAEFLAWRQGWTPVPGAGRAGPVGASAPLTPPRRRAATKDAPAAIAEARRQAGTRRG